VKGSPGVRRQVGRSDSSIGKRPLSEDFLPLVSEVQDTVAKRPFQRLLHTIDEQRLRHSNEYPQQSATSHRYAPDLITRIRNDSYCMVKKPWLRLRHNSVLANWFYRFNS
jgi:hypothetical protein